MSRNALISSWNKARGLKTIEKPSDVDEDEDNLIELELLELKEPDEQPLEVSDDENEPNPTNIINIKTNLNYTLFDQSNLINLNFNK